MNFLQVFSLPWLFQSVYTCFSCLTLTDEMKTSLIPAHKHRKHPDTRRNSAAMKKKGKSARETGQGDRHSAPVKGHISSGHESDSPHPCSHQHYHRRRWVLK